MGFSTGGGGLARATEFAIDLSQQKDQLLTFTYFLVHKQQVALLVKQKSSNFNL